MCCMVICEVCHSLCLFEGFPVLLAQPINRQYVTEIERRDSVIECLLLVRFAEYLLSIFTEFGCFVSSFCEVFWLLTVSDLWC